MRGEDVDGDGNEDEDEIDGLGRDKLIANRFINS